LFRPTSFDFNPVFYVICGHCPFWDMQLEAISLPFKTVRVAANDKSSLCEGFKATQVFYTGRESLTQLAV